MAITRIGVSGHAGGLNGATTAAVDTTGANFIVLAIAYNTGATATVSDSKSNTWTALTARDAGTGADVRIFYCMAPTVGAGHTFTVSASGAAPAIAFDCFAGVKTSAAFDVESGAATTSVTTIAAGSITPTQDGDLIFACLGLSTAETSPTPTNATATEHQVFVSGTNYGLDIGYAIQSTATAVNVSWSWSTSTQAATAVAAFKAVANLTSGVASFSSATDTTITVSVTAASGGSPAYSYQWYRSTTANFTPGAGNLLSGATSTTLADSASLVADTAYYYVCRATDSLGATSDSNQVAGALMAATLKLGCLGDSITKGTAGPNPAAVTVTTRLGDELKKLYKQRDVTVSNQGVDGKGAVDFAADTGSIFTNAKAAFASASVTHVLIMLGANDASAHRTAAQFKTDLQTIIGPGTGSLITAGYKVILNYPTYIPAGANSGATDQAATEDLRSYLAQIDSLIDGTNVLRGDTLAYQYFMDHRSEVQTDDTHLLDAGNISLANMWARAVDRAILQSGGGLSRGRAVNAGG